jgi:hypothetical protein
VATTHGQAINALQPGKSLRLVKVEYGGSLEARRLASGGVAFYWRHTEGGKTERTPIGTYDAAAPPKSLEPTSRGYSVAAALEAARALAKKNSQVPGGLRAERERQQAATALEKKAQEARSKYTLEALCDEYCAWLKARGKASWREAEILFSNHVVSALPDLAATPAAEVEKRQIVEAVRKLTDAGKQATARKLRSYLRAAYATATRADSDASVPSTFIAFNISSNPVESTAAIRGKADKNPLTIPELRRYWEALKSETGPMDAALRLHLLSGGQRIAQLARVHARDAGGDTMKLLDPKGKREEARVHLLPITKSMRAELEHLAHIGHALSADGGKTAMHPTSLSARASEVGKKAKIEGFQLKRVRSGVETALAAAGFPLHIRGQLQSHGISGVQATHYDAHEYLPEKRKALDALHALLERKEAKNVTPIGSKKRA